MSPKLKAFVINALRRAHNRWFPKSIALEQAKSSKPYTIKKDKDRSRNAYECAHCKGIFRAKEINVDHITPVVDPKSGFTTFDDYIESLFVKVEGYQILCIPCHKIKTKSETDIRTKARRNNG
jgi:5-methylcytosine-specific restriction endonuclease McrA